MIDLIKHTILNSTNQLTGKNFSNCCDARIINGDVCSDCKEHCAPLYWCDGCHNGFDEDELTVVGEGITEMSLCEGCRSKEKDPKDDLITI